MIDQTIAIFLFLVSLRLRHAESTLRQCQQDCRSSAYTTRGVGPTRPFESFDSMGNVLNVTRPYPYHVEAYFTTVVTFEMPITLVFDDSDDQYQNLTEYERICIIEAMQTIMEKFGSDHVILLKAEMQTQNRIQWELLVELQAQYGKNDEHPSEPLDSWFKQSTLTTIYNKVLDGDASKSAQNCIMSTISQGNGGSKISEALLSRQKPRLFLESAVNSSDLSYHTSWEIATPIPNPYIPYCVMGCSYFFSDSKETMVMELSTCLDSCNSSYDDSNISTDYNDQMKVANLECQDGCIMALQRCQPGYFCIQPLPTSENDSKLIGGEMRPCERGTYREKSYHAVEACLHCPPGSYRDGMRGISPTSCRKCPVNTYSSNSKATSISNCIRCPEGTFTDEEGSAFCKCITPMSCPT